MAKRKAIKDELSRYIELLEPNTRIPSRNFICKKWHISRSTADAIILELKREGLVYCVKGSGTFTTPRQSREDERVGNARKQLWAILVPDLSLSLYPKAFQGIIAFAHAHSIDFMVRCTDDDSDTEYALIQHAVTAGVDGMIIIPALTTTENLRNYQYLIKSDVPFVFWQRSVDYMRNIPQVLLNGYYGGYIAAKHLLDNGYRRIAYVAQKKFRSSMDRYMGYCAALSEAGLEVDPSLVRIGMEKDTQIDCIRSMLQGEDAPDGFICFREDLAADVVHAVCECGLRISDDVGVIGFEGVITWLDDTLDVLLTYVDISYETSGEAAAQILWDQIHSKKDSMNCPRVIPPKLVIRDSCKGKANYTQEEINL